ncbi:MAG: hypothetical protein PSV13_19005 [Lacunisphaera sp.]|nr:hypothetical protein [Lacunisphaera sp.]
MFSFLRPNNTDRFSSLGLVGARWLALALILLGGQSAYAEGSRNLSIRTPSSAVAEAPIEILLAATTSMAGETIAFFHAEYSVDNGKKWTPISYETDAGAAVSRNLTFKVGPAGTVSLVRVRVAYRSKTGDFDFTGTPIKWDDSWKNWLRPPAKYSTISVVAR